LRTEAAVLHAAGRPLAVETVEIDELGDHEVLVELVACGVCHTDVHMAGAGSVLPVPVILGHEGAGVVERVGAAVSRHRVGEAVVTSLFACGHCLMCATGRMHLCRNSRAGGGAAGAQLHLGDGRVVARFAAGAFSRHVVVHENALVGVDPAVPLDLACLLACGVSTGWGAVVNRARVTPGESVVVWGCGGVGMAAVAGAAHAGAGRIVAVDTLEWKTDQAGLHGATHVVNGSGLSDDMASDAYRAAGPQGADVVVVTVGSLTSELFSAAYRCLGVGGRLVTVSAGAPGPLQIAPGDLNVGEKTIMGSLMGSASPLHTITELSRLYRAGKLNLEAFVTGRYPLERVNEACSDLLDGKNVRGILTLR